MAIRLLVSDIDGTLADRAGRVSERTLAALGAAEARGVTVTLATGRTRESAGAYLRCVSPGAPAIFANGAVIAQADTGRVLYEKLLAPADVQAIWERGRAWGAGQVVWSGGVPWLDGEDESMGAYRRRLRTLPRFTGDTSPFRESGATKLLWVAPPERIRSLVEQLAADPIPGVNWHTSSPTFLEFVHGAVSKGEALRRLAALCGVRREEIFAAGDEMNDLSMLSFAGLGVAMGDACEALRGAADHVTAPTEEDGLAQAIERYILVNNIHEADTFQTGKGVL